MMTLLLSVGCGCFDWCWFVCPFVKLITLNVHNSMSIAINMVIIKHTRINECFGGVSAKGKVMIADFIGI